MFLLDPFCVLCGFLFDLRSSAAQLGTADAGVLVHSHAAVGMEQVIVVREWDADRFHQRVLELESQGYEALRETYRITAEMDPGTGNVIHLHSIEMRRSLNSG